MRSQKPAIPAMSAPGDIASVRCEIAAIDRSVAAHRVNYLRQLARYGDTGFAVTGAFDDRLAHLLTLSAPLKRVIKPTPPRKASVAHHMQRRRQQCAFISVVDPCCAVGHVASEFIST